MNPLKGILNAHSLPFTEYNAILAKLCTVLSGKDTDMGKTQPTSFIEEIMDQPSPETSPQTLPQT